MFRELDQRRSGQITVTLEWEPATGNVQVRCEADGPAEETFRYSVDPREGRRAFLHPYALRPPSQDATLDRSGNQRPNAGSNRWRRWFHRRPETRARRAVGNYSWAWWLT